MKVLVIGGTGALGGHAALHLARQGHDVTITGRSSATLSSLIRTGMRWARRTQAKVSNRP